MAIEQEDFPPEWECQSEEKGVRVEVRVADRSFDTFGGEVTTENVEYSWIEIPTTSVELWVEKGGAAQIQRTAKVQFPSQWGNNTGDVRHNSPRQLITEYNETDAQPFMFARVYFQKEDGWVMNHLGWVGGVGPASDTGQHKLWIYDFAELLDSVPVGHTFKEPTVEEVVRTIYQKTIENTPTPASEYVIVPPGTEEELSQVASEFDETESDDAESFLYDSITFGTYGAVDQFLGESDGSDSSDGFAQAEISTGDQGLVDQLFDNTPKKTFKSNHDTLRDMYDWFEKKTGANLHFEPAGDAVRLIADVEPTRRTFSDTEVISYEADTDTPTYEFYRSISVYTNDALYEMKPTNTLQLRGERREESGSQSSVSDSDRVEAPSLIGGVSGGVSNEFPVVKVQVPSLVEAAEGYELAPEVVESDATDLDKAENEAIKELQNILEEESEGEIIIRGDPLIRPFDSVHAFEVCRDHVEYEQTPVMYEVESVKHVKTSDDIYKTSLTVSVWANDRTIETVEKHYEEITT